MNQPHLATIADEFPDYPEDALPPIPRDWQPVHWKNDVCPSWHVAGSFSAETEVRVFIEWPELADRETAGARFAIVHGATILRKLPMLAEDGYQTDSWPEILYLTRIARRIWGDPRD